MDIKVLQYVIDYEHEHLLDAVAGSRTSLEVAIGVAKSLIANNGDPTALKGKQLDVYEECIKPVFIVACSGINGDDTCSGTGWVDGVSISCRSIRNLNGIACVQDIANAIDEQHQPPAPSDHVQRRVS